MALDPTRLKSDLETLFTTPPLSAAACADAWAAAYATYAAGAKSCGAPGTPSPASLSAAQTVLAAALLAAFTGGTDPVSTASALGLAFTAFWLTPPVAFAGSTPGAVTVVGGTAALESGLPSMWASNVVARASAADAAQAHADILDLFTKTVVVAHAPPSACAAPIT